MIDVIEANRHAMICEKAKDLLKLISGEDAKSIEAILHKSKNIVDTFNNSERVLINMSKIERGWWDAAVKRVIKGQILKPHLIELENLKPKYPKCQCNGERCDPICDEREELYRKQCAQINERRDEITWAFMSACDKTVFENSLIQKYIILRRRWKWPDPTPLEIALRDAILTEILNHFINQNQQLIYETSKQQIAFALHLRSDGQARQKRD